MSNLTVRVISALCALFAVVGAYYFFDTDGVIVLSLVIILAGAWEYAQICLKPCYRSRRIMALYFSICCILLPVFSFASELTLPTFAASLCLFFTGSLWVSRDRIKITALQNLLSLAALGFVYCTLFPSFAFKILQLEQGPKLFMLMLLIVFAGDVFAYFVGKNFGKHRLMPALSPKKTVEGSVGGAIGSVIIAVATVHFFYIDLPVLYVGVIAFFTGVVAQTGDLFESLLKRVAGVKDSGKIMPGHGGVLDRLDGVYFGAPVFFCCHMLLTQ